jgi:hypothetical protein
MKKNDFSLEKYHHNHLGFVSELKRVIGISSDPGQLTRCAVHEARPCCPVRPDPKCTENPHIMSLDWRDPAQLRIQE